MNLRPPGDQQPIHRTVDAFGEIADLYSATWFDDPVMEPSLNLFASFLPHGSSILDVGCGPGRDVRFMLNKGFEAIGIDLSVAMLEEARRRVPRGFFRRMDIREPHYPPESFNGIWACASLHHISSTDAALAVRRYWTLLCPGGVLAVSVQGGTSEDVDPSGIYCKRYCSGEFRQLLIEAGFHVLHEGSSESMKNTLGGSKAKKWLFFIAERPRPTLFQETPADSDCPLCPDSRFACERLAGMPAATSILWGNQDCYVKPDLAPVVEGHLLLIATPHLVSFGACPETVQSAIVQNQERIARIFKETYDSPVLFFEHGPIAPRRAGSCIDHAHLHCVPVAFELVRVALERSLGRPDCPASPATLRQLHTEGKSYIYYQGGLATGYAYQEEVLPSQFFRQILAALVNSTDWRWQSTFRTPDSKARHFETLCRLLPLADASTANDEHRS